MHEPKPEAHEHDLCDEAPSHLGASPWSVATSEPPEAPDVRSDVAPDIASDVRGDIRGEVAFTSPEAQIQRSAELLGDGAVVVTIPAPRAAVRGRLGEHIDERIERELAARGAPSPYLAAWSTMPDDVAARVADQLFRARTIGAAGVAIILGSLAELAWPALTPEDSTALRALASAASEAPLALLLDDGDLGLRGYGDPVALTALLDPPEVDTRVDAPVGPPSDAPLDAGLERAAEPPYEPVEAALEPTPIEPEPLAELAPEPLAELEPLAEPASVAEPSVAEPERASVAEPEPEARDVTPAATAGVPVAGPRDVWRAWALSLGAARGPLPLNAFERLFVDSYVPLANAITRGLDDPRALRAYDEFRRAFERSYADAFATFGATNRRPRLVMDAFDLASKQARLHNARTAQVLVVDSMRFDLGCMVRDAFSAMTAGAASLTAEMLLWSALPTTTYRQLETLARGMDALRAPAALDAAESLRGRPAEAVRRLRVGSRELHKLDVVPAALAALGQDEGARVDAEGALTDVAEVVAGALARHAATLPPRTLLFVAGDHGFTVDRRGRLSSGGAAPEEVLVPAFTWLVGDLH